MQLDLDISIGCYAPILCDQQVVAAIGALWCYRACYFRHFTAPHASLDNSTKPAPRNIDMVQDLHAPRPLNQMLKSMWPSLGLVRPLPSACSTAITACNVAIMML